eukprot:TRINITY_DN5722_c2_g1_i1.p1 TRINITY_DN5722_c2_g1~~TRINITY_DN5722_c2_g1_i1.p1  ORF type:complete len:445 (+),score=109.80 TRINITY_DN5722_c2_g1_i1:54-1388(+)
MVWRTTFNEQVAVAKEFLSNDLFKGPILMMWLQAFGGAFHSPVTTFFFLELGATELDIGTYNFVASGGALLTAPLQGWYLDKYGGYTIMLLSCFLCAVGCFIRGYAPNLSFVLMGMLILGFGGVNMEMVTLSYIVKVTSEARRSAYVSGFMAQMGFFRIFGRSLFPLFDWLLREKLYLKNDLNRFRLHMSGCITFCFFGMWLLYRSRKVLINAEEAVRHDVPDEEDTTTEATDKCSVVLSSVAVAARSAAAMIIEMLWPLFLRDTFGWGATEYSYVLFLNSVVMMIAVSYAPRFDELFGHTFTVNMLSIVISFTVLLAFQIPAMSLSTDATKTIHIVAVITCCAAIASLEPVMKVFTSLFVVRSSQARAFGGMATASGLGAMLGSFVGAALYQKSKIYPVYLVLSCTAVIIIVFLNLSKPSPYSPKPCDTETAAEEAASKRQQM